MALWIRVALFEIGIILVYVLVRIFLPYFMRDQKKTTTKRFKWIGIALYAIHASGIFLNLVVFTANYGTMPITTKSMEAMYGKGACEDPGSLKYDGQVHACADQTTRLPALADRFLVKLPTRGKEIWSIGDVLGYTGISALLCFVVAFLVPIYIKDLMKKHSP